MSFPRAKLKRFNEFSATSPAPGVYSPNYPILGRTDSQTFTKATRFPVTAGGSPSRTSGRASPSISRCTLSSTPNLLSTSPGRSKLSSRENLSGSSKSLLEPLYKDPSRPKPIYPRARSASPHTLRERMTRTKAKLDDVGVQIEHSQKTISATQEKLDVAQSGLQKLCTEIEDSSKASTPTEPVRPPSSQLVASTESEIPMPSKESRIPKPTGESKIPKPSAESDVNKMAKSNVSLEKNEESLDESIDSISETASDTNFILAPQEDFDIKSTEQTLLCILQLVSELITDILVSRDKVMTAFTEGRPNDKRQQKLMIQMLEKDRESLEKKLASSKKEVEDKFRTVYSMVHKLWDNSRSLLSAISSGGSVSSKTHGAGNRSNSLQSKVKTKLKDAEIRARQYSQTILKLEKEIAVLKEGDKSNLKQLEESEDTMKSEIESLKAQVAKLTDKNKQYLKRIDAYKKRTSDQGKGVDLVQELQSTSEQLALVESNLEKEQRINKELTEQIKKCQDDLSSVIQSRDKIVDVMQNLKDEALALTTPEQTEQEVQLTLELQACRLMLGAAKEELALTRIANDKMLEKMHTNTDSENQDGEEPADVRTLSPQFVITLLQSNVRALLVENQALSKTVEEITGQLKIARNKMHGGPEVTTQIKSWQKKVRDLENELANAEANLQQSAEKTADLEKRYARCQLELDQRTNVVQEQAHVIRSRDELLGAMTKSRDTGQDLLPEYFKLEVPSVMKMNDAEEEYLLDLPTGHEPEDIERMKEIINQILKRAEQKSRDINALKALLEQKQMHINRLQAAVNLMETQQERTQAQRTRQEARIAQLEHELQEKEVKIQSLVKTGHSMLRAWRKSSV